MLENKKAVIFDLDGTLVDSMWMWKEIDREYLKRYHIQLPEDLQKEIEGMSFSETANYFKERFQLEESIEDIKATWNQMAQEKYRNEVPLKKGALDFLKYLKKQGIKTGIATSNSIQLVKLILKKHNLESYFEAVHTSCEVGKGKPAPDIYLYVAKKLGIEPEQCLVFEDIVQGIQAGKSANMTVCAVEDLYSANEVEEKKKLSDYYINNFMEIEMK